jgi:hypothetical protein
MINEKNKMISTLESFRYLKRLFPPHFVGLLSEEDFLYRLLVEKRPELDVWRQHINNCLELAYRYNLLNADLEARLKKGDKESWQATMNELRVAKLLENMFGKGSLSWHPKGREKKVGEFKLATKTIELPIFVEIKTVFPREMERLEQRVIGKLFRFAEQVPIPSFLHVQIEMPGTSESFSGKKFKSFLIRELSLINPDDLRQKCIKLPDYRDNITGLHLKIETIETLPITPNTEERNCHIGMIGSGAKFIKNEVYIHHSLYKAYAQLPVEKQPCLVILCSSTAFPINEHIMLNALLGTLAFRVYQSIDRTAKLPEPEPFRKFDGFFQSRHNRKLSAVGLYKEKLAETGMEVDLEIYHNPFTVNQLKDSIFKGKGIRQLVKKNDQEMEWINKIV